MTEPWIDTHLVLILFHILGVALGAGAAFTGDLTFITSVRNKRITSSEFRIMRLTSRIVWIGVIMLILSGVGLVLLRPEIFLHSGKFWAKMTVLGIIISNGLLFHFYHLPTIKKSIDKTFAASLPLIKKRGWLVGSGAVSVLSWNFVIILGVLHKTPFSFGQFLGTYLLLFAGALLIGLLLRKKFISY